MKLSLRICMFIAIIFILNIYTSYSLSLQIISADTLVKCDSTGLYISHSVCKNISATDQNVRCKIHIISMPNGYTFNMCDMNNCYPNSSVDFTTPQPFTLKPNATTGNFVHVEVFATNTPGIVKLSFTYYVENNETDYVGYNATFDTTPVGVAEDNNTATQLINIYPNPANNFLNIDLSKYLNHNSGTIEIYNSLGNLEKTLPVNSMTENLTINTYDLSAGTYLMVLKSNGTKLLSQPFMIYR